MANGNKVNASRTQYVVKANDLIRSTRYSLTTQQQKIILFAISKIKPNDDPHTTYELSIEELCATCGIELDTGGFYYRAIKQDLIKLTQRLWVQLPDQSEATISWIGDAQIIPLSGMVYIRFHERMMPYLFDLREHYTQYHLQDILLFKSKYSIRLYELLRSYIPQRVLDAGKSRDVTIPLDQLRRIFDMGDKYKRWAEFDRNVIRKAVQEINAFNEEMFVEYEGLRGKGREITQVWFGMKSPTSAQRMAARANIRSKLK